jgi:tetratricopeptide (TPR) repeat protein
MTPSDNNQSEVTARILEQMLARCDKGVAEMLHTCALPHSFNLELISWMNTTETDSQILLTTITQLSFVSQQSDEFFYHDLIRTVFLQRWWSDRPKECEVENAKLAAFFDKKISEHDAQKHQWSIEKMYHLLGAGEEAGIRLFRDLFEQAERAVSFEFCDMVVAFADEQRKPDPTATRWVNYFQSRLLTIRGKQREAESRLKDLLEESDLTIELTYFVLHSLGILAGRLGDIEDAISLNWKAIALAQDINQSKFQADEFYQLGRNYKRLGHYEEALHHYSHCLNLYQAIDAPTEAASVWLEMGNVYTYLGKWDQAHEAFLKSQKLYEGRSNLGRAEAIQRLGWLSRMIGQLDNAALLHEAAIDALKEIGVPFPLAEAIHSLGNVFRDQRRWYAANAAYTQALELFREIDASRHLGIVLKDIASILYPLDYSNQSLKLLEESTMLLARVGDKGALAEAYLIQSNILFDQSKMDEGRTSLQQSLEIAEKLENPELLMRVLLGLARLQWETGDYSESIKAGQRILELAKLHMQGNFIARAYNIMGKGALASDSDDQADHYFALAIAEARIWNRYLLEEILEDVENQILWASEYYNSEYALQICDLLIDKLVMRERYRFDVDPVPTLEALRVKLAGG